MAETPAVCEHLHLPPADRAAVTAALALPCIVGTRLSATWRGLADARAAGLLDLAVTTDTIGLPLVRSTTTRSARSRWWPTPSYDSAYTFVFSPRPGTEAAAWVERYVPADVIAERFARLTIVVERSALLKHQARVGRIEEVLIEGPSRKDPTVLTGRTRQNKLVHFAGTAPMGSYGEVTVTGAAPHHLTGELPQLTARPRHKTRIPVAAL